MIPWLEILALVVLAFWLLLLGDRRRSWPGKLFLDHRADGLRPSAADGLPPSAADGLPPSAADGLPPSAADGLRPSAADGLRPSAADGLRPSAADGLRPSAADGQGSSPPLTVIVPARNEASLLPRTLASLLTQESTGLRVVVVDDQSEDGTAEVAHKTAAQGPGEGMLRVLRAAPRPPGWTGKVHALNCGLIAALEEDPPATREWLLFTDADILHPPGSLRQLVSKAEEGSYDLVSVMARLNAKSVWERFLIPPFVFFFHLLYPFRLVARPGSRVAAAAGGCVLVRRRTLEAAGGLAAIRRAVIDDVALAKVVKESGGRLWLGFHPGIVSVRPYRTLAELWQMVARSAYVQLRYRFELLLMVLVGMGVFFATPPVLVLGAASGLLLAPDLGSLPLTRIVLWGVLAWSLQTLALLPYVRHHRVPWPFALTLPLSACAYALMMLTSAWNHYVGTGSAWKGRSY